MSKRLRRAYIITFSVLFILIYFPGVYFFSSHTYPFSEVNGVSMGLKTKYQVDKKLQSMNDVFLTLRNENGKDEIKAEEVDYELQYDTSGFKDNQHPWLWPKEFLFKSELNIKKNESINDNKLRERLLKSDIIQNTSSVKTRNAEIVEREGVFKVQKEIYGNQIDKEKYFSYVASQLNEGNRDINLRNADMHVLPTILSDNESLNKRVDGLNKTKNMKIEITINDEVMDFLKDRDIDKIFSFNEDGTFNINNEYVSNRIDTMCQNYETIGRNRRFKTMSGDIISLSPGNYGSEIDKEKLKNEVFEGLKNLTSVKAVAEYKTEKNNTEVGDIGNTFIEIDLNTGKLVFVKDGKLLASSQIVSGEFKIDGKYAPRGVYRVIKKEYGKPIYNNDPEHPYEAKVNMYIQFTDSGFVINDAPWINDFKDKTDNEFGCINVPTHVMKEIYDNISDGQPIIIY